jgi:rhodanese-related sulfurtransferase
VRVTPDVASVTVDRVPAGACLLDVREPDEWAAGHAPGAVHIPMSELLARFGEVPADTELVVVCRSGNRSAAVTAYLAQHGYAARNLAGGMLDWQAAGRPMVAEAPGMPPHVA